FGRVDRIRRHRCQCRAFPTNGREPGASGAVRLAGTRIDLHFEPMSSLLALTWRCLLIVGLVFNPVAGMGVGAAMAAEPASHAAKAPCHGGMAMQPQASAHDSTAPC